MYMYTIPNIEKDATLRHLLMKMDAPRAYLGPIREITHLDHELGNDPVKDGSLVTKALLPSTEGPEILSSLRNHI